MKNIDVIRHLVSLMSGLDDRNRALKLGVLSVLDVLDPETVQTKDEEPEKKESSKRGRKPFDIGKAKACYEAGWSIAKIADEMSVTEKTVRNNLKKAGVKIGATIVE